MTDLLKIQRELDVPKGLYNSFGKYPYRSCELILAAVKPLLEKYNCDLYLTDTIVVLGDRDNQNPIFDKDSNLLAIQITGNRFYIKSIAHFTDSEQNVKEVEGWAREEDIKKGMDASQITGSTSSYARKYALSGLFLLDGEKDADATNNQPTEQKSYSKPDAKSLAKKIDNKGSVVSEARAKELWAMWRELGLNNDEIKEVLSSFGFASTYAVVEEKVALITSAMKNKVQG